MRTALDATHMALREYVAQVAATVRRDEPQTVEIADVLLAPLSARAIEEATQDEVTMVSARAPVA